MDFKDFKKVSEDKQTVTLQHPKSKHTIVLIVKNLKPIEREALKRLKMADGGIVKNYDDGGDVSADSDAKPPVTVNVNTPPASQVANVPVNPQVGPSAPGTAPVYPNQTGNAVDSLKTGTTAANEQQAVDTEKAKALVPVEQARIKASADQSQNELNHYNDVKGHTDDYAQYLNDHPEDVDHYVKNMGTGNKLATAFGLLAGGFTNGFTHGAVGNTALNWLNTQIDRDVSAQRQNADKQHNIYSAYQSLYGDSNVSDKLARASIDDVYSHKINQIAASLGTPQAQAARDATVSKLQADRQQNLLEAAKTRNVSFGGVPGAANIQTGTNTNKNMTPNPNQKAIDAGLVAPSSGGMPQAEANVSDENDHENDTMLKPDSNARVEHLISPYNPQITDAEKTKISEQHTAASKADAAIGSIRKVFPKLKDESTYGDWVANHINPHALGAAGSLIGGGLGIAGSLPITAGLGAPAAGVAGATIGGTAGEVVGGAARQIAHAAAGQSGIQYNTDKSALVGYIKAAIPNVGDQLAESIAEDFTPGPFDSKDSYDKKLSALIEKIHDLTPKDALERNHITK